MTLILERTATAVDWLGDVLGPLRTAIARADDPAGRADAVADALADRLPPVDVLNSQQRAGSPEHYQQHVLHVEPGGAFSVTVLVWRPGQSTPIHDHVCWCTVGVLSGVEHEVRYGLRLRRGQYRLVEQGESNGWPGQISGFAPPGDIHLVRNAGSEVAISVHVYGADIGARGTSVRRTYSQSGVRHRLLERSQAGGYLSS
jgi:3-mercaptopropionate dioxygenase